MAGLKNKKHLFFDLDDTLWDFKKNSSKVLAEVFDEFGLGAKLKTDVDFFLKKYHEINLTLWSRYYKREIDKQYMRENRFWEVFAFFESNDYEESVKVSHQYLERAPHGTILKEGALETLEYLCAKYKLHIITNGFMESQFIKIDSCGLRKFFKNIIISEEHELVKPEVKIFRLAETLAEASPEECVMIGDSLESDIAGGLNAGWETIYFNEDVTEHYTGSRIHSLKELIGIF